MRKEHKMAETANESTVKTDLRNPMKKINSDICVDHFISSQNLHTHPLARTKSKSLRGSYYASLCYFVAQNKHDSNYINARLEQYHFLLIGDGVCDYLSDRNRDSTIRSIVNNILMPWRRKYRFWMVCDIALILADEETVKESYRLLKSHLSRKQIILLDKLLEILFNNEDIPASLVFAKELIAQFRINREFSKQREKRFIVTANMSAGKSTLINAIIGKPLTRTSLEACTGNLCYLYNKPFEDSSIHLCASPLKLSVSYDDLAKTEKTTISHIASYFRTLVQPQNRVCIIDTPGVNFSQNQNHGELTRKALKEECYDKLIYILNAAGKLGTEEELSYLKYVSKNIPQEKVVFVLNKLDEFRKTEDSIEASIEGVKNDLHKLGYENPTICPLSAYFALLIKLRKNGEALSDDEQDTYSFYVKKFSKAEYDLSLYYDKKVEIKSSNSDELIVMSVKCGLYGLENILFGEGK